MADKDIGKNNHEAQEAQPQHSKLLDDSGFKMPENQSKNAENVKQGDVNQVKGDVNHQAGDKSASVEDFSPKDLKVASGDKEITDKRANLGESAKCIGECLERLNRGPASGEAQKILEGMMKEWKEHMEGKNVQTGEKRGSAALSEKLVSGK